MEEKDYLSKIAVSKEKTKLGIIVHIEGSPKSVIISEKPHAIIKVKRFIFSPDYIHLPLTLVIEKTETSIQFDITKIDFQLKRRIYRTERKNRVKEIEKRRNKDKDFNKDIDETVAKSIRRW